MYSIELAIIIPIIIILIVTALMMFQFAVELDHFEIYHSRAFLLSLLEPSTLNGYQSCIVTEQEPYQTIRTMVTYDAKQVGVNAFERLNGKGNYLFNNRFYMIENNRMVGAVINRGYNQFLNED